MTRDSQLMATETRNDRAIAALEYSRQVNRLSYKSWRDKRVRNSRHTAVEARFVTDQDPVVVTATGDRLPVIPLEEATRLNHLKHEVERTFSPEEGFSSDDEDAGHGKAARRSDASSSPGTPEGESTSRDASAPLKTAVPPARTTPLFPPIPLYGPPGYLLKLQSLTFRVVSFFLSLAFLGVIVLGAVFTGLPPLLKDRCLRLAGVNPDVNRPFYEEELRRQEARKAAAETWKARGSCAANPGSVEAGGGAEKAEFEPTEGGDDPIVCDIGYYARRVGLDVEEYEVQTEDGFIISLWHVFDPKEHTRVPAERRHYRSPDVFSGDVPANVEQSSEEAEQPLPPPNSKYPVLMMHGLLQSSGAYCANDDNSLAFYLCKSGYDVWLGDNRCGFRPRHTLLKPSEPRMWAWNIRQMGVMDLPALVSRVLAETRFATLALVSHSQGTTQAFVALAKQQRPELGRRLSVFCALAPAVYAGPLIGKAYFKFMRAISPALFRLLFGIHAFLPVMPRMHALLPARVYGALGYRVFSFLFHWTDARWERALRHRMFQFAPTYVSAESMRWWLGRDCFAKHKCILATRDERKREELEDAAQDRAAAARPGDDGGGAAAAAANADATTAGAAPNGRGGGGGGGGGGVTAWYDEQVPPFALWVAGADGLVDGRRLLRRFERGREPHVRVVHARVIEHYEHLDVIWAVDVLEQVGREMRDVVWRTMPEKYRAICRVPRGCQAE